MLKKLISLFLSFTLIFTQPLFAQGVAQLNLGSYLSTVGQSIATDRFRPLHMRYFSYDQKADNFQLLLDKGDNKDIKEPELEEKTKVLMDYFQIGLSLPNDKFWVNLRPDAQDEMIDPELEKTDMGKVMLEADLQLKRDTALSTSPQTPEGKQYWDKLYKKAGELFGTENITIPTITRPWIVPGEVILRQGEDSAYIFKANMKVMLEHDYLVSRGGSRTAPTYQQYAFSDPRMKELNEYSSQLIRELIIPKLTKEVNSSKRYAPLRQVFFSLVMARWFKDTFSGKPGQYAKLIDSHNLNDLTSKQVWDKTYYFNEYKKSFEQGEYNLKENITTPTGQVIRSYVSGGISSAMEYNPRKGEYHGNGKPGNGMPVFVTAGYNNNNGRNVFSVTSIDVNGKMRISSNPLEHSGGNEASAGSALILTPNYENRLDHFLEALKNTSDTGKKILYLQELKNRLLGPSGYYSDLEIREIVSNVMPYLAEKNEKNDKNDKLEETRATAVAADILNHISWRELRPKPDPGDLEPASDVIFLTPNDIESIKTVILDGIEFPAKPYLASQALRVILFRAMNSRIPYVRHQSVSLIGGLAELLMERGVPDEIKTQFLKQVESAGAINIEEGEASLGVERAIEDAQKSLRALQKSMRGASSSLMENEERRIPLPTENLEDLLDRLLKANNSVEKSEYIKKIEEWLNGVGGLVGIKEMLENEIVKYAIQYLTERNENTNTEEISITEPAANIIKYIAGLESPQGKPLSSIGITIPGEPPKIFLSEGHIRLIFSSIKEGFESSKPYLASEALGVILFIAANSKIESRRIEALSRVQELVNLLSRQGMPQQDIKIKFLEQVKGISAINADQERSGEMRKIIEEVQESLVRFSEKLRKGLEEKLWVIAGIIEKMLNENELSKRKNRGEIDMPEDRFKDTNRILSYLETLNRRGTVVGANEIDGIIKIISEADLGNYSSQLNRVYLGSRLLSLDDIEPELKKLKENWQKFNKVASSSMATISNPAPKNTGGIDFRQMNYLVEPMGSFKDLRFSLPTLSSSALEKINLDLELESMRDMVKAGMVPSGERVKEYLAACFQKGKIEEKQDDILVCLAEIYRLAEEEDLETSPELRESLVIVDTGKFVASVGTVLS